MPLALGIDTGGTYTDAVLVDYASNQVLASAKALTTREDLAIGIRQALDGVLKEQNRHPDLVSLSTTLATNAIVEGQGSPVGVLLLGYRDRLSSSVNLAHEMNTPHVALIDGGHTTTGEPWRPLDMVAAEEAIRELAPKVSAIAISGYFGTRNPEHEIAVRQRARELTDLPITCGHELTHRLDAMRRATTVALNASLIPLICRLIDSVRDTMASRGINAPLMVVKGDGSLMDASLARERPIETILSGPAASVVGAQHLSQNGGASSDDMLVVDMGGTTTDIAMVRADGPKLSPQGAQVGRWRTMVEAIDVHTSGLGGDSRVWLDETGDLALGPRRVIPLALLAVQHPDILADLQAMIDKGSANLPEFWVLQSKDWPHVDGAPPFADELGDTLKQGPLPLHRLPEIVRYPQIHQGYLWDLERQGIVLRAGLTPTDAAHLTSAFDAWDGRASHLGLICLARRLDQQPMPLAKSIMHMASRKIAGQVLAKLLADDGFEGQTCDDLLAQHLIARALDNDKEGDLRCHFTIRPSMIAIGAPAPTYFAPVADMLHCNLHVPEHAGVANALGAVAGSVVSRVRATVLPQPDETLHVHLPDEMKIYVEIEPALAFAQTRARELAALRAEKAGADDIRVSIVQQTKSAPVANGWGDPIFLSTSVIATAVGRPRLAQHPDTPECPSD